MTAVVVDALHIGVLDRRRRVRLVIADDKVFLSSSVNIALYFRAIIQRNRRACFRADADFSHAPLHFFNLAGCLITVLSGSEGPHGRREN